MQDQTFISCVSWILRGYAASAPKQMQLTEQEVAEMKSDPMVSQGLMQNQGTQQMMQQDEDNDLPIFGQDLNELMNSKSNYPMGIEEISDDEKQDFYIKQTDALIVAGKIEKDHSSLEVYIYEQEKNNMYVHHEIMLSSFPLDIEWLRVDLGSIGSNEHKKGNYGIVGSFLPEIQFWNLDVLEAVEPELMLGGEIISKSKKPKKFSNSNKKFKQGSHTDSVLSLSLNKANIGILASGSADNTVKIWDISKEANIYTAEHHQRKVKKVEWSETDASIMFSCSDDNSICILDSRFPDDKIEHKTHQKQVVQSACWNINNQSQIIYVTDSGNLNILDARKPNEVCASLKAHNASVNDVRSSRKNLAFTCSQDQYVRVWNLLDLSKPIASKNPKCGKLFCMDVMQLQDGPILSVGNQKGELFVWQIAENPHIQTHLKSN